ncbi:MAG TPA: ABC transporter permease [Thermoanaerobaculia bacterium]|nr:ABC transporter permease [Thermoanaerobaculia bacterium]
MGKLVSDLRFAARTLAGRPAFTLVAVLTLALGIGANTAIFSVVDALLLRPLPYREPGRLVWMRNTLPEVNLEMTAGADYLEWRDSSRTLSSIAAFEDATRFTRTGGESPERLQGARVSASFLPTLGIQLARGRGFDPPDERLNAAPVAVVSDRLWRRLFGTDTGLAGQGLTLDGIRCEVVGVLPRGFVFPGNPDVEVLMPLALDETRERARRQMTIVQVVGRLAPGATLSQARTELAMIQKRSVETARQAEESAGGPQPGPGGPGPGGPPRRGPGGGGGQIQIRMGGGPPPPGGGGRPFRMPEAKLDVMPLSEHLLGNVRPALLMLLGAVGFVLLIACANVANLLLARATARRREIAIRAALGAGRRRIAGQLLVESALLGLAGGACGLLLAFAGIRLLLAMVPADLWGGLLRQTAIGIDGPVLLFTLLLSLATGLLFGLAPALGASRVDLTEPLKEGGRGHSGRARGLLVAAEMALAVVLLVLAGLLFRSFLRLRAVDPGFTPERVLTMPIELPADGYTSPAARVNFFQELSRRAAALPGVESAAFSDSIPLSGVSMILRGLRVEGRDPLPPEKQPEIAITAVSPDYFRTMGIRIVGGRAFSEADTSSGTPVAVISRSMARKLWGDTDAVGRRLRMGPSTAPWTTVVGVAVDVRQDGLDTEPRAQMYRPFLIDPRDAGFLAVRTAANPAALIPAVRREVMALDRNVPLYDIATMEQRLAGSVAARRFNLVLLGLFAALALALAGVGLYGVLGYAVTERTREIGVRMALGAQRRGVLGLIIRQGLTLAAAGVGFGLVASFACSRLLRTSLFGITTNDPVTYVAIPLLLMLVALLSSYLPARRATRVDPLVTLRVE